jgi:outer membrane protein OmpA-like peptidoglycan-associated protein
MKIVKVSLTVLSVGFLAGLAQAEWGHGLGNEFKSIYVPAGQQSGWVIPEPVRTMHGNQKIWILSDVRFETDSEVLKLSTLSELNRAAEILKNNPKMKIEVRGFADSTGEMDYNYALSEQRAESVRAYLIEQGVSPDQVTTKHYGETKPIASNKTPEGRALNRRIAFHVISQ